MSPGVVDDLEVVEIEQEDGRPVLGLLGACAVERSCDAFHEQDPVRQAGERVVERLVVQTLLELHQLLEILPPYHAHVDRDRAIRPSHYQGIDLDILDCGAVIEKQCASASAVLSKRAVARGLPAKAGKKL